MQDRNISSLKFICLDGPHWEPMGRMGKEQSPKSPLLNLPRGNPELGLPWDTPSAAREDMRLFNSSSLQTLILFRVLLE